VSDDLPVREPTDLPLIRVTLITNGGQGVKHGRVSEVEVSAPYSPDIVDQLVKRVERMHGLAELQESLHDDDLDEREDVK
jgi:hypothetical protein